MENEIFRRKSLDRMRSPEELNDYIRVSNPGVWLLLAAILVLLAGVCIWGIFGRIETTVAGNVTVAGGNAALYISGDDLASIPQEILVRIGAAEYAFLPSSPSVSGDGGSIRIAEGKLSLPDGIYAAEVITERIKPMSFLFN